LSESTHEDKIKEIRLYSLKYFMVASRTATEVPEETSVSPVKSVSDEGNS